MGLKDFLGASNRLLNLDGGGQLAEVSSLVSMCVLGIELRSSGLAKKQLYLLSHFLA